MKTKSGIETKKKRQDWFKRNNDEIKLGLSIDQAKARRKR